MTIGFPGFFLICHQDLQQIHFSQLLEMCSNRRHQCYEKAWAEFERRYRNEMIQRIRFHLRRWHRSADRDLVEEVLGEILMRLIANEFRALHTFRAREDENRFRSFLNVICRNTANQVAAHLLMRELSLEEGLGEVIGDPSADRENIHDLFDYCVFVLRNKLGQTQKSGFNIERDILVFLLRLLSGFRAKEVAGLALLDITPGNIENVIYRLKNHFD